MSTTARVTILACDRFAAPAVFDVIDEALGNQWGEVTTKRPARTLRLGKEYVGDTAPDMGHDLADSLSALGATAIIFVDSSYDCDGEVHFVRGAEKEYYLASAAGEIMVPGFDIAHAISETTTRKALVAALEKLSGKTPLVDALRAMRVDADIVLPSDEEVAKHERQIAAASA